MLSPAASIRTREPEGSVLQTDCVDRLHTTGVNTYLLSWLEGRDSNPQCLATAASETADFPVSLPSNHPHPPAPALRRLPRSRQDARSKPFSSFLFVSTCGGTSCALRSVRASSSRAALARHARRFASMLIAKALIAHACHPRMPYLHVFSMFVSIISRDAVCQGSRSFPPSVRSVSRLVASCTKKTRRCASSRGWTGRFGIVARSLFFRLGSLLR